MRNTQRKNLKDNNRFVNSVANDLNRLNEEQNQPMCSRESIIRNKDDNEFKLVESRSQKRAEKRQIKSNVPILSSIFTGTSLHKYQDYKDI